ncbi:MAG: hypothetical protein ACREGR_01575 [Minisyncoccia bacterium]
MHHAYVVEGGVEEGVAVAERFVAKELGMKTRGNPDLVVLRYGLLSAEEAREIPGIAAQGPIVGTKKVIIIAAARAYHEAQNALLKIFEEPPPSTYLFLILPNLGALLPTLRSRIEVLAGNREQGQIPEEARGFLNLSEEKRSAFIKKLASGRDEEERRVHRDEALAIVNGVEAVAYEEFKKKPGVEAAALLSDISKLRDYLHAPSAPVRMILEHLSLTLPENLL